MFVRASLHKLREENQLDATECFYCTYNLLNMFRAIICPSSEARVYTCVIAAYGVTYNLLNMFRAIVCPSSGARDYTFVIATYGV